MCVRGSHCRTVLWDLDPAERQARSLFLCKPCDEGNQFYSVYWSKDVWT